jgi:tubulin polyglutamylase TTLL2
LRIYVALTSLNPLRIYVFEEGLCRFASEKYDTSDLKNIFSHLTNYSINKKHNEGRVPAFKDVQAPAQKHSTSTYTQKYQNNYKTKDDAA